LAGFVLPDHAPGVTRLNRPDTPPLLWRGRSAAPLLLLIWVFMIIRLAGLRSMKIVNYYKMVGLGLFLALVTTASFLSSADEPLKLYQKHAKEADLILRGKVDGIEYNTGYYGDSGNKPVFVEYQYVSLYVESTIKGNLPYNPITFKTTHEFLGDHKFVLGEELVVMLKWYESQSHGEYYAPIHRGQSVYLIQSNGYPETGKTITNPILMGNEWNIGMDDFLSEIR
jgi:hypothetical protein